jgi:hypothetical protein
MSFRGEKMRTVIGLAGVKTSGKSTVANMIMSLVPNAREAALADKLKNTCAQVFEVPREYFDRQDLKEVPFDEPKRLGALQIGAILESFGVHMTSREIDSKFEVIGMMLETPRKIAQIVGTEVLRQAGNEDIHCDNVELNNEGVTVISDLRFPNEFNYFKNNKDIYFMPLYISRQEAEQHVTEDSHPSEKCVFEFNDKCIKIDNNGSLEDTKAQVFELLKDLSFGKVGGLNG